LTPLFYSRSACRALAALPGQTRRNVRAVAESLQMPGPGAVRIRVLPGGFHQRLVQVSVDGASRLVCRLSDERIDVLAIIVSTRAEAATARRNTLGAAA